MTYHILLTVDVEDWFQVENFRAVIPASSWSSRELRVETNTHNLLDLFDEASFQQSAVSGKHSAKQDPASSIRDPGSRSKVHATFFVLGWLAERIPKLVQEIHARGHEIASHGYAHEMCTNFTPENLRKDLVYSKKLLEDIIGKEVCGYRAPTFSVDAEILKIIQECGYLYDSSYNSFGMNSRYGKMWLEGKEKSGIAYMVSESFYELPVSNLKICNRVLPWGGGGYFRLIPLWLFRRGVHSILGRECAYLFYVHPWETDPLQPRVTEAPMAMRFRHYTNIGKTYQKLKKLIEGWKGCRFAICQDYLEIITESERSAKADANVVNHEQKKCM
jgi:polysaccharide deacetylase family protein (PEP-CTERM system associated)